MRLEYWREEHAGQTVLRLTITDADLARASFEDHEQRLVRGLEEQQRSDPTTEGALMVAQMYARAIERARKG